MAGRLDGKIALITGGSAGIGAECAKLFAREGATVIAGDVKPLEYQQPGVEYMKLDVADPANCQAVADAIVDKYGRIDILVNNAGITRDGLLHKMTDEMWDAVLGVNLKGIFNTTRVIGPMMMEKGYGAIVNISSGVGENGNIGQTNYSAAKAGILGMTKTWSKELTRKGANIRTNAITPGFIRTDIVKTVPQEVLDAGAKRVALGRLGEPEEVAAAVLFLASDEASYINGVVLQVNGGRV